MNASTTVLEMLLDHASCDVDLRNRLAGDTPLHLAVRERWEGQQGLRLFLGGCGGNTNTRVYLWCPREWNARLGMRKAEGRAKTCTHVHSL